ncbi:30S ribosomal protein S2, partial [candidate division WOR-3 bacterium]|nr:30S ribosomal protein S2 [candidate division WOR-3 bacterium]
IKKSIDKYNELEKMFSMQSFQNYTKKEIIMMKRKMEKMKKYFEGIKDMKELPDIMYIIDIKKEINAVREANLTNIPVIGVVDTNSNPTMVTYPIPANDDAIESIQLITNVISTAIAEGKKLYIDRAKKSKVEKKEPPKKKEKKNES